MTPKQQYEARKAERQKLSDMEALIRDKTATLMMLDMVDRFVTAAERIADALERPSTTFVSGGNGGLPTTTTTTLRPGTT